MSEDAGEIQRAVRDWLEHLVSKGMPPRGEGFLWEHLAEQAEWAPVRHAVTAVALANDRDDLCYRLGDPSDDCWAIDDQVLLHVSGLGSLARALTKGEPIDPAEVAEGFARFCAGPRPAAEDWLLIEATFPQGTRVAIGEYTLQTFTLAELRDLHPFPGLRAHLKAGDLTAEPLAGAPFLHRISERGPSPAFNPQLVVRPRPETEHWQPLLPLLLWSPELTRIQANYQVERGRRVRLDQGSPSIWMTYHPDDDLEDDDLEEFDCGDYRVGADDVGEFTVFCKEVVDRMQQVFAENGKAGKKRARRLTRAAQHLVRAAHRTYGGTVAKELPGDEAEEVLLQYVIAMEALLADEDNLDLSRKVAYRAATLWQTDTDRQRVAKLVKDAYTERSKYVHGDDIDAGRVRIEDLRAVASETLLRWLVLASSGAKDVPGLLDSALLSETVRRAEIIEPINTFFRAVRARSVSGDAADQALDGTEVFSRVLQSAGTEAGAGQEGQS
ncbi:hypothetical protein [Streptacidiphilus sp. PAMC 29251]